MSPPMIVTRFLSVWKWQISNDPLHVTDLLWFKVNNLGFLDGPYSPLFAHKVRLFRKLPCSDVIVTDNSRGWQSLLYKVAFSSVFNRSYVLFTGSRWWTWSCRWRRRTSWVRRGTPWSHWTRRPAARYRTRPVRASAPWASPRSSLSQRKPRKSDGHNLPSNPSLLLR